MREPKEADRKRSFEGTEKRANGEVKGEALNEAQNRSERRSLKRIEVAKGTEA